MTEIQSQALARNNSAPAAARWATLRTLYNPVWILLVCLIVMFAIINPQFLTTRNLANTLFQGSYVGLLSLGMTLVMISGNIDLTVGSMVSLAACLAVGFQPSLGVPGAAILAAAAGAGLGLLNGTVVEKTGVNSFVVTLGGLIGIKGLVFLYTNEQSVISDSTDFVSFGSSSIGPVPTIGLIFLLACVLMHILLRRTVHGRDTYAIGGNRSAAVNAGVQVSRRIILNFGLSGLLAAIAGILMATQLGAASPTYGENYELWAVIATVIGGTKLSGGYGGVGGMLGGVLTLAVLRNGMNMVGLPAFYVFVVVGLTLIIALLLDRFGGQLGRAS